ncbi:MAG: DUF3795 domain-containing protein [Anaerolineae bacterium]|nr:DUF3795 domain-containing protein [Anaerolineae bacterium]
MAEQMIAYCGLICTDCPAYVATQTNDMAKLQELAKHASQQFGITVTAQDTMCDGCLATSDRKCGYCAECQVRACAVARGVATCAHCDNYGCEILTEFLKMAPEAKVTLDAIRADL